MSILCGIAFIAMAIISLISHFYIFTAYTSRTAIPKLLLQIAIAMIFIFHSDIVLAIYPIVIALLLLFYSLQRLEVCYTNKEKGLDVFLDMIYCRIAIVIAMIIIVIPTDISNIATGLIIGISLILSGGLNLALIYYKDKKNNPHRPKRTKTKTKQSKSQNEEIIIEVEEC